jgi:hypothetical protein
VNPFGTDETDIDIKHLLKTHIQVSKLKVGLHVADFLFSEPFVTTGFSSADEALHAEFGRLFRRHG